jgi:uncharacterized cupin superfamily protein
MAKHPIVNLADLELRAHEHGDRFGARIGPIGERIGALKLGYNLTVLAPGKRAWPFHNHRVNEEMFLVLEGQGEVRIGDARHPLRAGDVLACPPGGPQTAHQIINSGSAELKFLAVSTMQTPEIAEYPDSQKIGVSHMLGPTYADGKMRILTRAGQSLDYWDGE